MYKLAQLEDRRTTLDNVAWYVHWQLCGKTELEWEDQHTPEKVVENLYRI